MPDIGTGFDELQIFHTGADCDGGYQNDALASLGGNRAGTRPMFLQPYYLFGLPNIEVIYISPACGEGTHVLTAESETELSFTPSGGSAGDPVTVADDETKIITGSDITKFVIVTKIASTVFQGSATIQALPVENNVIGGSNFSAAESTSGHAKYTKIACYNAANVALTNIKLSAVSNVTVGVDLSADSTLSIPDEDTAPVGISFGAVATFASLAPGSFIGFWISREVSAGASANALVKRQAELRFDDSTATTRFAFLTGYNAIAEAALDKYGVWYSILGDPGLLPSGLPDETYNDADLPYTMAATFPADTYFWVRRAQRNQHGLWGPAQLLSVYHDGAVIIGEAPGPPDLVSVVTVANFKFRIDAIYIANKGELSATDWVIYWEADGTSPDPTVDTPKQIISFAEPGAQLIGPARITHQVDTAFLENTVLRVLVRMRRRGAGGAIGDSQNTEIVTGTLAPVGPKRPHGFLSLLDIRGANQSLPLGSTVVYDATNNVRAEMIPGATTLYKGSTILFRIIYDTHKPANNGIWTTFQFVQAQQSGTPSDTPVESQSLGNIIYISVQQTDLTHQFRLLIDIAANEIKATRMSRLGTERKTTKDERPIVPMYTDTAFQVIDKNTLDLFTAMNLAEDGDLIRALPWKERATAGEIPEC